MQPNKQVLLFCFFLKKAKAGDVVACEGKGGRAWLMTELHEDVCASPGESALSDTQRTGRRGFSEWKREESKPDFGLSMSLQTCPWLLHTVNSLTLRSCLRHYTGSKTQIY